MTGVNLAARQLLLHTLPDAVVVIRPRDEAVWEQMKAVLTSCFGSDWKSRTRQPELPAIGPDCNFVPSLPHQVRYIVVAQRSDVEGLSFPARVELVDLAIPATSCHEMDGVAHTDKDVSATVLHRLKILGYL